MILDNNFLLSGSTSASGAFAAQSVNGAGSFVSTNTVDLLASGIGAQLGDLGGGERPKFAVTVVTAPTVGSAVQFQLIQADDAALSSNVQVLCATDAIPVASLPAGALVPMFLNKVGPYTPKRYLGVRYVNTGAIATASYIAGLAEDVQSLTAMTFKNGFSIS